MRLATFNAENLFSRPKVMQYPDWADGRQALEDFTALSRLIEETVYTAAIKASSSQPSPFHLQGRPWLCYQLALETNLGS